jgi:hypothetical protein
MTCCFPYIERPYLKVRIFMHEQSGDRVQALARPLVLDHVSEKEGGWVGADI